MQCLRRTRKRYYRWDFFFSSDRFKFQKYPYRLILLNVLKKQRYPVPGQLKLRQSGYRNIILVLEAAAFDPGIRSLKISFLASSYSLSLLSYSLFLFVGLLPPFSLLRDFSFQNTSEHFAIRFRQSYLIREVSDVTAIELSSKE